MELTYDGLDLHDLGEITVSSSTEYEGGENPSRAKRTLTVGLSVFESSFAANADLLSTAKAKLKVQHGVLRWADAASQAVFLNQPVVVAGEDFPEEPNAWGRYHQQITIRFSYYEQDFTTSSAAVTLSYAAGNIELAEMSEWKESIQFERFSPLHGERRTAVVTVTAGGMQFADPMLAVSARRSYLQGLRDTWKSRVAGAKETTLTNGTFSKAVRLESFDVQVDQAVNALGWNFTAFYNLLPDETSYAIADYKVTERNGDNQPATGTGEQFLVITGTVTASSEAAALTRINQIRAAQVTARGYDQGELLRHEVESSLGSGGTTIDGEVFLEKTFTIELRKWRADNQALSFQRTGSGPAVNFGQVRDFTDGYNARRFSDQRSQRALAQGRMEFSGTLWLGALTTTVAARRALLTQRVREMHAAVNGADGRLIYGSYFDGTVRVEDFQPKPNQKLTGIDWSLTCSYSKFPNEAGYATVEMQAEQTQDVDSGDATLGFSGRIGAQTEAAARSKLETVRAAVLTQYGYTLGQQRSVQSTASRVSANGDKTAGLSEKADGETFIELSFAESYRRRIANLVSWNLRVSDSNEETAGFITTTYSGDVVASGADVGTAYATALAKAVALGDGKFPFRVRSDVVWTQRQTKAEADIEFVRLEFSYEYRRKDGARAYVEISSSTSAAQFGNDGEQISGSISAADLATAQAHYLALVKTPLTTENRLILEENVTSGTQTMQSGGVFTTPFFTRLEFQLTVFRRRTVGTEAIQYGIDTEKDWLALTQRSTVSGTCWATTEKEARAAVDGFLGTLKLGDPVRTRDNVMQQQWKGTTPLTEFGGKLDFEQSYESPLTGAAGILSCEVTEEIEYSGTRWVEQPLPRDALGAGGVSLFQDAGQTPGRRTVRGNVKASTLAVCRAWADEQHELLDGTYETAPQTTHQYVFAPRIEGVVEGDDSNVQLVMMSFTFSEWLPTKMYVLPV